MNIEHVKKHSRFIIINHKTKKEPKAVKSTDGVIRRNLDRIWVSAATPQPSNPSRRSKMSLTEGFLNALSNHAEQAMFTIMTEDSSAIRGKVSSKLCDNH